MRKIALLSCSSLKKNFECESEIMYSKSTLFRLTLKYCQQQNFDIIYILSAKYHLLKLNQKIRPYNKTLNKMNKRDKILWSIKVSEQINQILKQGDEIYMFAGQNYSKFLTLKNKIKYPLKNMRIGERLQYLKSKLK